MKKLQLPLLLFLYAFLLHGCVVKKVAEKDHQQIWTPERANQWYAKQGWLVGGNYAPAYAINQLEMWQAETFDTARIDLELSWAESIGMNTMRVFLHDLLYLQDSTGFLQRMDAFLRVADRHKIKTMFVLFDSVWDPAPKLGKQREPRPHTHNSGWVQSPGVAALRDTTEHRRLEQYVKGVVSRFKADSRVVVWDVWNEPDNDNAGPYGAMELKNKTAYVLPLLAKVFHWTRSVGPVQPLTAAIWWGNWASPDSLQPIQKLMVEQSDVISFHNYDSPGEVEKRIQWLQQYKRPLLCTEYMARPRGNTFEAVLPILKKYNVAAYNWGFVQGKSQTIYPWDSWEKTYTTEPDLWFHDVFRTDGTPYNAAEVNLIKALTGKR